MGQFSRKPIGQHQMAKFMGYGEVLSISRQILANQNHGVAVWFGHQTVEIGGAGMLAARQQVFQCQRALELRARNFSRLGNSRCCLYACRAREPQNSADMSPDAFSDENGTAARCTRTRESGEGLTPGIGASVLCLHPRALRRLGCTAPAGAVAFSGDGIENGKTNTPDDPGFSVRQDVYLRALKAHIPELTIQLGQFKTERKMKPVVSPPPQFIEIWHREEKGSDVNLAVHLVNDAWHDRFDVALVISNDSDLAEALHLVQSLGKPVGVATRYDRPTQKLLRRITRTHLRKSQMPEQVVAQEGFVIRRPTEWRYCCRSPAPRQIRETPQLCWGGIQCLTIPEISW